MSLNNAPGAFTYTIQPGDTIWNLAERNNISVEEIMAANPGVDPNNLTVGQVITIPPDPPPMRGPGFGEGRPGFGERRPDFDRREEFFERRPIFRPPFFPYPYPYFYPYPYPYPYPPPYPYPYPYARPY